MGMTDKSLCDSCTNIGCEFQSGIVRTKCAFYMPPQLEPDNCGNYVVQDSNTKNDADELISREDALMCLTGKFENRTYEPSELIRLFSKRIKTLSSPSVTSQSRKGHWIPVTERLPKEKTAVLLSCDDMYLARLNPCIGWRNGNYWHTFSAKGSYLVKYPIAWMPLTEPYKAESEKT